METAIGIAIWVIIFLVWYIRNYPEKFRGLSPLRGHNPFRGIKFTWPRKQKPVRIVRKSQPKFARDYTLLVETVELISSKDSFLASDAAAMVEAVKGIMQIEPASGQIWEAFALNALEDSEIRCDDCRILIKKTVKKTGVKIECPKCKKWLALRNSKVTVIDPNRADLEEWER